MLSNRIALFTVFVIMFTFVIQTVKEYSVGFLEQFKSDLDKFVQVAFISEALMKEIKLAVCCAYILLAVFFVSVKYIMSPYSYEKLKEKPKANCKISEEPTKYEDLKEVFEPEKMMPGSQFQYNAELPPFQCEILTPAGVLLGQAFLTEYGLITAGHVLVDLKEVILSKKTQIQLKTEEFEFFDSDVALLKLQQQAITKLGLAQGKLHAYSVPARTGIICSAVSSGKRSSGFVEAYTQFGYCSFGGSTIPGFSGCPYYLNKVIYGMHIGGCVGNIGYESAYLRSILRPTKTIVTNLESSDQWLIQQAQMDQEEEIYSERSPFDPDQYRIRLNSQYHIVDQETYLKLKKVAKVSKAKKLDYDFEKYQPEAKYQPSYQPSETDSEISDLPLCPRKAVNFDDAPGNGFSAPTVVTAGARGLEEDRRNALNLNSPILNTMDSGSRPNLETFHMEYLESTRAQPSVASKYTQKKLKRRLNVQTLKQENAQLRSRLEAIENGLKISQDPGTSKNSST